jgi:hypothetical protein
VVWSPREASDSDDLIGDGSSPPVRAGSLALAGFEPFGVPFAGLRSSGASVPSGSTHDRGLTEAWSTISKRPPGVTALAASCRTWTRGNSIGECRYWVETRSKAPEGKVRARSCCRKSA